MRALPAILAAALLIELCGCSKREAAVAPSTAVKPKQAATQIEQAFVAAEPEVKQVATVASQALKTEDYEAAVQSLAIIKEQKKLTFEQGQAVQNSMISLEARLIAAAAAGDANAQRAYDQLKKSRRK